MAKCPHCSIDVEGQETTCPSCGGSIAAEMPTQKRRSRPVLTIGKEDPTVTPNQFTRRDLLKGLRAAADGAPLEDFLPSTEWEDYTASLLEVLFRKHLVFPNEITSEISEGKKNK